MSSNLEFYLINEIEQIAKGITIEKDSPPRFYKNLSNLNINIKINWKLLSNLKLEKNFLIIDTYQLELILNF